MLLLFMIVITMVVVVVELLIDIWMHWQIRAITSIGWRPLTLWQY